MMRNIQILEQVDIRHPHQQRQPNAIAIPSPVVELVGLSFWHVIFTIPMCKSINDLQL